MIAVDNTLLTLLLHPSARPPQDPSTVLPVSDLRDRIDLLIETLDKERDQIIIPAPVLSEFLILAGKDGPKYLDEINRKGIFRIEAFDTRAAVELAAVELTIKRTKADKRDGAQGTWAKVKFDRQIVTIAKVNRATKIYSDDEGVEKFAKRCGIPVVKTWEMPLPHVGQPNMFDIIKELEQATSSPVQLPSSLLVESESHNEEAPTILGIKKAPTIEPKRLALRRLPTISESSAASSVSPEEGSRRAGSETGEE
jgi:predicted nucleic acid-binding protein